MMKGSFKLVEIALWCLLSNFNTNVEIFWKLVSQLPRGQATPMLFWDTLGLKVAKIEKGMRAHLSKRGTNSFLIKKIPLDRHCHSR
jgi:hypothetical protein